MTRTLQAVEQRGVVPDVLLAGRYVEDERQSLDPDDDQIEIGIQLRDRSGVAIAVTLNVAELEQLRDVLTEMVEQEFT